MWRSENKSCIIPPLQNLAPWPWHFGMKMTVSDAPESHMDTVTSTLHLNNTKKNIDPDGIFLLIQLFLNLERNSERGLASFNILQH